MKNMKLLATVASLTLVCHAMTHAQTATAPATDEPIPARDVPANPAAFEPAKYVNSTPSDLMKLTPEQRMAVARYRSEHAKTIRASDGGGAQNLTSTKATPGMAGSGRLTITGIDAPREKAAFLGVAGTPVDPALRVQLKLKKGIGVLVERIEAGSPAEQAGLTRYDVIEKLDDQWIVNGQQLAVLVRMHQPNDQVSLTILRQGERKALTAKLVEKDLPVLDENSLWGLPTPTGDAALQSGTILIRQAGKGNPMTFEGLMLNNPDNATITWQDSRHKMSFSSQSGEDHLIIQDNDGNVVFDGPVETEAQRQAIPAELLPSVKPFLAKIQAIRPKPRSPD